MSVYRPKGSRFFVYDFERGGRRFSGSTRCSEKRAAERVEEGLIRDAERKAELKADIDAQGKGERPMTLEVATARYFDEVGRHHAAPKTTKKDLTRAALWFGPGRRLDDIRHEEVTRWVAARRGEYAWGRSEKKDEKHAEPKLLSNARVNRSTVDLLRKVFTRARDAWELTFPREPKWRKLRLPETGELVRELRQDDETRLVERLPAGYRDLWRFALASGQRLAECFLDWSQVDLAASQITVTKKGGKLHTFPISRKMKAILSAQPGDHKAGPIFWYVCRRAKRGGKGKTDLKVGQLYPVTYEGMKTAWKRAAKKLNLGLRFHDMRHTAATRLLRKSGNLKHAQKLLGHADIRTTAKFYAHVTVEDLRQAMDAESPMESPIIDTAKDRKAQ